MSFYDIGAAASQQVLGASDLLRMAFLWQGSGKNRYFLWCLWCFEISSSYPLGTTGLSEPEKGLWISWSIGGVAMSRNIRVSEPSAEMQIKIIRAKDAIASQKPRIVRCPYCRHNSISNCPASSMSARIIFWWAASQAKRKSKMILWALFRSCLRLRRKSNRALRLEMTK